MTVFKVMPVAQFRYHLSRFQMSAEPTITVVLCDAKKRLQFECTTDAI